ncbi:hypothetical protein KQX54_011216 [Cotesia glomerata]|uniref:Uncharacterized protein n=1 Tax=Cotesia glomerata TaxID=32391 RepID=A0AAV7IML6_COTGL|nr:hypothetical protein KQX54_011216 [Cotesia glomerata]
MIEYVGIVKYKFLGKKSRDELQKDRRAITGTTERIQVSGYGHQDGDGLIILAVKKINRRQNWEITREESLEKDKDNTVAIWVGMNKRERKDEEEEEIKDTIAAEIIDNQPNGLKKCLTTNQGAWTESHLSAHPNHLKLARNYHSCVHFGKFIGLLR